MFERYVEQGRRAIFYAALAAALESTNIRTEHLLVGLCARESRANSLFRLRELLPEQTAIFAKLTSVYPLTKDPALADDSKNALTHTVIEARRLRDYWIDTEHLLLGILRNEQSAGARQLRNVGINLTMARQLVADNKSSRPNFGPAPRFWRLKAFFGW